MCASHFFYHRCDFGILVACVFRFGPQLAVLSLVQPAQPLGVQTVTKGKGMTVSLAAGNFSDSFFLVYISFS
jgi:hypothetical protein